MSLTLTKSTSFTNSDPRRKVTQFSYDTLNTVVLSRDAERTYHHFCLGLASCQCIVRWRMQRVHLIQPLSVKLEHYYEALQQRVQRKRIAEQIFEQASLDLGEPFGKVLVFYTQQFARKDPRTVSDS